MCALMLFANHSKFDLGVLSRIEDKDSGSPAPIRVLGTFTAVGFAAHELQADIDPVWPGKDEHFRPSGYDGMDQLRNASRNRYLGREKDGLRTQRTASRNGFTSSADGHEQRAKPPEGPCRGTSIHWPFLLRDSQ